MSKALTIMQKASNVQERAEKFEGTIARNLKKKILDPLVDRKEQLEDKIASLLDFSLDTNLNKGVIPVTREQCESRFAEVISLEYELKLLILELEAKTKTFDSYFGEKKVKE